MNGAAFGIIVLIAAFLAVLPFLRLKQLRGFGWVGAGSNWLHGAASKHKLANLIASAGVVLSCAFVLLFSGGWGKKDTIDMVRRDIVRDLRGGFPAANVGLSVTAVYEYQKWAVSNGGLASFNATTVTARRDSSSVSGDLPPHLNVEVGQFADGDSSESSFAITDLVANRTLVKGDSTKIGTWGILPPEEAGASGPKKTFVRHVRITPSIDSTGRARVKIEYAHRWPYRALRPSGYFIQPMNFGRTKSLATVSGDIFAQDLCSDVRFFAPASADTGTFKDGPWVAEKPSYLTFVNERGHIHFETVEAIEKPLAFTYFCMN